MPESKESEALKSLHDTILKAQQALLDIKDSMSPMKKRKKEFVAHFKKGPTKIDACFKLLDQMLQNAKDVERSLISLNSGELKVNPADAEKVLNDLAGRYDEQLKSLSNQSSTELKAIVDNVHEKTQALSHIHDKKVTFNIKDS